MLKLKGNDRWIFLVFAVLMTLLPIGVRVLSGVPLTWLRFLLLLPIMAVMGLMFIFVYRHYEAWLPLTGIKKGMLYGAVIGAVWTLVRLENWYLRGLFSIRTADIWLMFILFVALGTTLGMTARTKRHLLMQDARSFAPLGVAFLVGRIVHRLIIAWDMRPFLSGRLMMIWGLGAVLFALIGVYLCGALAKKNPRPGAALTLISFLAPIMALSWVAEWPLYFGFDRPPLILGATILTDLIFVGIGFAALLAHRLAVRSLD